MSVQAQGLAVHTVPKTMRAAAIERFGGPEVLSIHLHKLEIDGLRRAYDGVAS